MNLDRLTRAEDLLRGGNFNTGWPLWEQARAELAPQVPTSIPMGLYGVPELHWDQPLQPLNRSKEQVVIVLQEGGSGDTFMTARYAMALRLEGALVYWQTPPAMSGLMRTVPGITKVLDYSVPVHKNWMWIRSMSLPARYGIAKGAPVPYMRAPLLIRVLGSRKGTIGLRLTSGPLTPGGRERNVPRSAATWLRGMLTLSGREIVDLNFSEGTDWSTTAKLIARCESVITVDTGVAHLAGAMGAKTHILLNHNADWRWGPPGNPNTPWYPTARLYWASYNSWDNAVMEVSDAV